jgi:DNA-binding GntR family transcriptional regulator
MQIRMQIMTQTPEAPTPRYEQAYETIRGMIVDGRLRGGETISEVRLADELSISRTPVREAVRRLVGQGLVESTPRGLRVFRPKREDVAEVYFLRAAIEGALVRAAALRISAAEIEALRAIHARSLEAADREDIPALVVLNGEFHAGVAAAAGSGRAGEALRDLDPLVATYRRLSLFAPGHRKASNDEHGRLIELLERRDGARAEALMRAHIARAGRRITDAVLQIEPPEPGEDKATALIANLDGMDADDAAL